MAMGKEERSGWSLLPAELLLLIGDYLRLADMARLSAVCGGWAWALGCGTSEWPAPPPPPTNFTGTSLLLKKPSPWLILPNEDRDAAEYCDLLLPCESESESECECDRLRISPLPEMAGRICVGGSSDGWIATVDVWLNPYLLNPLTGEEFLLPCLGGLPRFDKISPVYSQDGDGSIRKVDFNNWLCDVSYEQFKYNYVHKIILSSAPHRIAFLIYGRSSSTYLVMARIGDLAWSPAVDRYTFRFKDIEDVAYNDKDCKFYVITLGGEIIVLDLEYYQWGSFQPPKAIVLGSMPGRQFLPGKKYVVFSSSNELLQVWRQYENDSAETTFIKVYKFDPRRYNGEDPVSCWILVNDLGDDAMFLGSNHSTCVPTSHKSWLRKNSVYFAEDRLYVRLQSHKYHAHAGIFDLKNDKVEKFFPNESRVSSPPPSWFLPPHLLFTA